MASIVNIFLQGSNKSVFTLLVVFLLSLFVSTFFVSFQADVSESIQIIFLMDEYFANQELRSEIKNDLNDSVKKKEFSDPVIKKMRLHNLFEKKYSLEKFHPYLETSESQSPCRKQSF